MTPKHILAIFFSCLICFPVHGYEPIEYLPDRVVVKYRPGEDIVTTAFVALKDYPGDPAGKPFIIQKSWLTEGEIAKLPVLLAYLESLGFHPFVETIQTPHNDQAQRMMSVVGGYLLERADNEPSGSTHDIVTLISSSNVVLFRKQVKLDEGGHFSFEFYIDEMSKPCHVILQTTNRNVVYQLTGPDGQAVQSASEKGTVYNRVVSLSSPSTGEWKLEVSGEGEHEVSVIAQSTRTFELNSWRSLKPGLMEIEAKASGYDSPVYAVCEARRLSDPAVFQKKILDHVGDGICKTTLGLIDGIYAVKGSLYTGAAEEKHLARTYNGVIVGGKLPPVFVSEAPRGKVTTSKPVLTSGLIGGVSSDQTVLAYVNGQSAAVTLSQKDPIGALERTEVTISSPALTEGDHRVEAHVKNLSKETAARTSWEFTVDLPTSQSILINEVFIYGDDQPSWVELYAMQDADLSEYRLTDLDGKPMVLTPTSLPLKSGQYALLYFTEGQNRIKGMNGAVEIYLNEKRGLSRTDDQIVLLRGDAIIDAAAWSDKDGKIDRDEAEDLNTLMAAGEWDTGATVRRGNKGESFGRKGTNDLNKAHDFGVMPSPSPGKDNSNIVEGSHLGVPNPGSVLINEIQMASNPNSMSWAELVVVSGPVDLMEFVLTDQDGIDYRIAVEAATLNTGEYAVVYWAGNSTEISEVDGIGDDNNNGHREFYITDQTPNRTEDQLALIWEDTVVVDAVAWTDGDGNFGKEELGDALKLVSTRSWKIAFDGTENGLVPLNQSDLNSVGRIPNAQDGDVPSDWKLMIRPTPGKPNILTEKPSKGSVLIYEVEPSTQKKDYAVLYCAKGPVDISAMTLTDLDGEDGQLSEEPVTLNTGDFITVWWQPGTSEVDGKGDLNANGQRDIYTTTPDPASSDDQVVLMFGADIYDAVVFTNNDGKIDPDEMKDARVLIQSGEWTGTYDVQTDQRSSVNVGLYRLPIIRKSPVSDSNSKADWESRK